MLNVAGSFKVYVATESCDLRPGFYGLHGLMTHRLVDYPRQSALFALKNRRQTRLTNPRRYDTRLLVTSDIQAGVGSHYCN